MRRYTEARSGVPYVKTSCVVMGERQIETFEAMQLMTGLYRPHQLVADIVLDAIRKAQKDPEVQRMVEILRSAREARGVPVAPRRGGLSLVAPDSAGVSR